MSTNVLASLNPTDHNVRHFGCKPSVFALLELQQGKNKCSMCNSTSIFYTCISCFTSHDAKPILKHDVLDGNCSRCHVESNLVDSICLSCLGITLDSIKSGEPETEPLVEFLQEIASDDNSQTFNSKSRSLFSKPPKKSKKKRILPKPPAPAA